MCIRCSTREGMPKVSLLSSVSCQLNALYAHKVTDIILFYGLRFPEHPSEKSRTMVQ